MICGPNVALVPFQQQHLERSREWFNDPGLASLLNRSSTITEEEHLQWFQSLPQRTDLAYFAIELEKAKKHIGNIWLADIDRANGKAELRIVIGDSSSTSRGLGSEAMELLCDYAFGQLNLHRVYAYVLGTNARAKRGFEKAGFTVEGVLKDDRWTGEDYCDAFILARLATGIERGQLTGSAVARAPSEVHS